LRFLQRQSFVFDVVIAGGGPAGLSAALVLGRCRRRILLCDSGAPRNARSRSLNGYLTRDGIAPREFLQLGRDELAQYGVQSRSIAVTNVTPRGEAFDVELAGGDRVQAITVLLATGVIDRLPDIPGLADCYGVSVHHCPYCDGWEHRDERIAVIAEHVSPAGLALSLKTWTDRVTACTNGGTARRAQRERLAAHGIPLETRRIERIEHDQGEVRAIRFKALEGAAHDRIPCDAIFFSSPQDQHCELARRLGCQFTPKGTVKTDRLGRTCVSGIFVVGDASRDVQFVVVAAAEGAKAGVAINQVLQARAGLTTEQR
jgi:thioredoxin reductase